MMRFIQNHVSLSVQAGLALFGAVLLWSSSFIALKIAVSAFDPMVMVFGRMLSSLVALMLLRAMRKHLLLTIRQQQKMNSLQQQKQATNMSMQV